MMGGTCDSVGVGGCWSAGCYGPFTRKFGSGALNILEAKVVLADGSLVTASKCSHPDLFMSIRGGGGGLAGVVTEFTARSHRAPEWTSSAGFTGTATTREECTALFAEVLKLNAASGMNGKAGELCDNGGLSWSCDESGGSASFHCGAYEGDPEAMKAQLQPLAEWAKAQGGTIKGEVSGGVSWNNTHKPFDPTNKEEVRAALPNGMIELHPVSLTFSPRFRSACCSFGWLLIERRKRLPAARASRFPLRAFTCVVNTRCCTCGSGP